MTKREIKEMIEIYGSQRAVAKKLGVSQSYVSRLLNEQRKGKTIRKKVSRRLKYQKKKYFFQWRVKVVYTDKHDPKTKWTRWYTSEVVEAEDIEAQNKAVKERIEEGETDAIWEIKRERLLRYNDEGKVVKGYKKKKK